MTNWSSITGTDASARDASASGPRRTPSPRSIACLSARSPASDWRGREGDPMQYMSLKYMSLLALVLGIGVASAGGAAETSPLMLESKIPLGEVKGRIDHFAVDL